MGHRLISPTPTWPREFPTTPTPYNRGWWWGDLCPHFPTFPPPTYGRWGKANATPCRIGDPPSREWCPPAALDHP